MEPASCDGHSCFYCGRDLVVWTFVEDVVQPQNMLTRDHVVPRLLMKIKYKMTTKQKRRNIVDACQRCNVHKASKDPLDYLVSPWLPDAGSIRLRDRLNYIGLPHEEIAAAWHRRERMMAKRRSA